MTPQERKLVDELFDRLATLERNPRDAEAERAIADGLRHAPNAPYALAQTVLVQDEALKKADTRIRELEAELGIGPSAQPQPGGFLDSMRGALFGGREPQGSVPTVRPSAGGVSGGISAARTTPARPGGVWGNTPAPMQPGSPVPQPGGWPAGAQAAPAPGLGTPGGSFLGTAAAAAAGAIGGALLMNSMRGMFGSQQQPQAMFDQPARDTPWAPNNPNNDLSREAGLDDIGRGPRTAAHDEPQRTGLFGDTPADDAEFDVSDAGDFDIGGDSDVG